METLELSIVRAIPRASRWLAAGLFCLGAGSCVGLDSSASDELGGDIDHLAETLVANAKERTDLRQIRVWVADIHETRATTTRASTRDPSSDMTALQIEHELVIALASRLNVVESELGEPPVATDGNVVLGERATAHGATH